MKELRKKLEIPKDALKSVNDFLLDENNPLINDLFSVIEKYGGINEINKKAEEASKLDNLIEQINKKNPNYVKDIEWLINARDNHSFISVADYRRKILGDKISDMKFNDDFAVTLELSACQYFPFFIDIAKDALENQKLVPGRIIRVRKMKETMELNRFLTLILEQFFLVILFINLELIMSLKLAFTWETIIHILVYGHY